MPKVLPYGSRVSGVEPQDTLTIIIQPEEVIRFFCELLKTATAEGADSAVRKAKARSLKDGLVELKSWETFLGEGFFADCSDPLSLITTDIRWDNQLNKYVVFGFIDYLISLMPNYYNPDPKIFPAKSIKLKPYWSKEGDDSKIQLSWYGLYAEAPTDNSYPTIQLGDPHGLTFKTEVAYPNITLSRQRNKVVMQRKPDYLMRYEPFKGSAKLKQAPKFDIKQSGLSGDFEVFPQIKDVEGVPLKFSWLELGEAVKMLVRGAIIALSELKSNEFAEDRYAWGSFAPQNTLRKEPTRLSDVFDLAKKSKVLFDLACLISNECAQFIMPVSISRTKEGRHLVDSVESPTYAAFWEPVLGEGLSRLEDDPYLTPEAVEQIKRDIQVLPF